MERPTDRLFARRLGLSIVNIESKKGIMVLRDGTPAHKLWQEVMTKIKRDAKLPGEVSITFKDVEAVVDRYGDQVWGAQDRTNLVVPGEYTEYEHALFWDSDRMTIVEIFGALFEWKAKEERTKRRLSARTSDTDSDGDVLASLEASDDSVLDAQVFKPKKKVCIREPDGDNMYLATLWIFAPQIKGYADLDLGKLYTKDLLFSNIARKLNKGRGPAQIIPEAIQSVVFKLPIHLGCKLDRPILIANSPLGDDRFRELRSDMHAAWTAFRAGKRIRENGMLTEEREESIIENVTCIVTVQLYEGMFAV